jgi:hypothetical protein
MTRWSGLGVLLISATALMTAGCFQPISRNPTPTPRPQASPTPEASPTAPAGPSPTAEPSPTPLPSPTPRPTQQAVWGLYLEIMGLSDESVIIGDTVTAVGRTSPDAIVSINGVIVPVDADGSFSVQLSLVPGPNMIEVVASDFNGNRISEVLAVVSLPDET